LIIQRDYLPCPSLFLVAFVQNEEDDYDADSLMSSQGDVGESFRRGARVMVRHLFYVHVWREREGGKER
jgi:hypothetical protein